MREVKLLYNGAAPDPNGTINLKNLATAERIGRLLYDVSPDCQRDFFLPLDALTRDQATNLGITGEDDLYGGVVRDGAHADKALLHSLPDSRDPHPDWYSPQFAKQVESAVLPGFTVFNKDDALVAYDALSHDGLEVRVKDPSERNARGQFVVTDRALIQQAVEAYGGRLATRGAVVEANLTDLNTVAVGAVTLGGRSYAWFGRTWDVMYHDELKFGGNEMTVVRGSLRELSECAPNPNARMAIEQTEVVLRAYESIGAVIARSMFDVVQGRSSAGEFMSGVVDPSIRPSASSPAEIYAIEAFSKYPDATAISTRVVYDYGKHQRVSDVPGREHFAASHKTNIFVELVSVHY